MPNGSISRLNVCMQLRHEKESSGKFSFLFSPLQHVPIIPTIRNLPCELLLHKNKLVFEKAYKRVLNRSLYFSSLLRRNGEKKKFSLSPEDGRRKIRLLQRNNNNNNNNRVRGQDWRRRAASSQPINRRVNTL